MAATIYLASRQVFGGYNHSYLVYDADGDPETTGDQEVIRGGQGSGGEVEIRSGVTLEDSGDDFVGGEDYVDRNYTTLVDTDAATVWELMMFQRATMMRLLYALVAIVLGSEIATASDNRVYTYDGHGMIAEIKDFRKGNKSALQLDVTQVIKKYIPSERPKEEVFAFLHGLGFRIYENTDKRSFDSQHYGSAYAAVLRSKKGLGWTLSLMSDELIIVLYVNTGMVVAVTGEVQLLHP